MNEHEVCKEVVKALKIRATILKEFGAVKYLYVPEVLYSHFFNNEFFQEIILKHSEICAINYNYGKRVEDFVLNVFFRAEDSRFGIREKVVIKINTKGLVINV